jgi:hypothetical protein
MSMRVLADDGSIHQFPDGTSSNVINAALARYHASQEAPGMPDISEPSQSPETLAPATGYSSATLNQPLLGLATTARNSSGTSSGAPDHNSRRQYCIEQCSDLALPTRDYGTSFNRCVQQCMGTATWPEWEKHFPSNKYVPAPMPYCKPSTADPTLSPWVRPLISLPFLLNGILA